MDPKYSEEMLKHLEKQNDLLMEAYRSMSHELHKMQVEEEMLMRKFYEIMESQSLKKKDDEKGTSNEHGNGDSTSNMNDNNRSCWCCHCSYSSAELLKARGSIVLDYHPLLPATDSLPTAVSPRKHQAFLPIKALLFHFRDAGKSPQKTKDGVFDDDNSYVGSRVTGQNEDPERGSTSKMPPETLPRT